MKFFTSVHFIYQNNQIIEKESIMYFNGIDKITKHKPTWQQMCHMFRVVITYNLPTDLTLKFYLWCRYN